MYKFQKWNEIYISGLKINAYLCTTIYIFELRLALNCCCSCFVPNEVFRSKRVKTSMDSKCYELASIHSVISSKWSDNLF